MTTRKKDNRWSALFHYLPAGTLLSVIFAMGVAWQVSVNAAEHRERNTIIIKQVKKTNIMRYIAIQKELNIYNAEIKALNKNEERAFKQRQQIIKLINARNGRR
jgi:hypothetical protein